MVLVAVPVRVAQVRRDIIGTIATVGVMVTEGAGRTDFSCFGCIGGVR